MLSPIFVIVAKVLAALIGLKSEGAEKIPEGTVIIISNHEDTADGGLFLATSKKNCFFVIKEDLASFLMLLLKLAIKVIVIPRPSAKESNLANIYNCWRKKLGFKSRASRAKRVSQALGQVNSLLSEHKGNGNNSALVIFIEGTREKDSQLQKGLPGAGRIALSYRDVPIVPAALSGTRSFLRLPWAILIIPLSILRVRKVSVVYGDPFYLPDEIKDPRSASEYMTRKIAEILPPERKGCYAEEEQAEILVKG